MDTREFYLQCGSAERNSSARTEDGKGSPLSSNQSPPVIRDSVLERCTGQLFLEIPDLFFWLSEKNVTLFILFKKKKVCKGIEAIIYLWQNSIY